MSNATVSETLAEWILDTDLSALPEAARTGCTHTIIDTVALTVAALETDYGRATREAIADPGDATVFGSPDRRSPEAAAVLNGTLGHGEDFDNTFEGCPVHSGVVIVPALVAAGERWDLSSESVGKGIAVGIEVMCRLGLVADKAVHKAGFHPTAVLGAMAATAGICAARGAGAKATADALGVAGSLASGIIEYLADGSWTKRLHAGWAAQCGLRAAALGAAGFVGPRTVFEGTHGLFKAFANTGEPDFSPLTSALGTRWEAGRLAFKPYACGTMTQPYVDCAVELKNRGVEPEAVESIVCEVGEGTVHRLWEPLDNKQRPPTPYAAKFSGPYCVAAGLVFGNAGLAQFTPEALADERVQNVAAKVTFEVDPQNEYPANYTGHVKATLAGGAVEEARAPCLRGGARAPLSREDIMAKCEANLRFAGRDDAAAQVIAAFADGVMTGNGPLDARRLDLTAR